jgi:hypothetical protein
MPRRLVFLALVLLVMVTSPLAAQQTTPQVGPVPAERMVTWNGKDVPLRENLLSVNPLGIPFEYFSGEFEHAVSRSTSLALTASYASPFDFTYTSFDVIGRYYPGEVGLRGFSIGPTIGFTHVAESYAFCFDCNSTNSNAFTMGAELDYSWILGPSQHFGVEVGVGAKHLFLSRQDTYGASTALPTARISVGYAF